MPAPDKPYLVVDILTPSVLTPSVDIPDQVLLSLAAGTNRFS
jgi:hypothetical protein